MPLAIFNYHSGISHYLRPGEEPIYLFLPHKRKLPKWFSDHSWEASVYHKQTGFLPPDLGLVSLAGQVTIKISSPERAILECLYLAPREMDLVECYQIMEGLVSMQLELVIDLLGKCSSVHVKRLFLFMAEKARHQWFSFINPENVDLGKGNRSIVAKGIYNSKY